jgi:uncharacterized membrane protein
VVIQIFIYVEPFLLVKVYLSLVGVLSNTIFIALNLLQSPPYSASFRYASFIMGGELELISTIFTLPSPTQKELASGI